MTNQITSISGNVNTLAAFISKLGFDLYGSFNEDAAHDEVNIQHDTYTCTKGKYSGDVIDIYYNYITGQIHHKEVCSQFIGHSPIFCF